MIERRRIPIHICNYNNCTRQAIHEIVNKELDLGFGGKGEDIILGRYCDNHIRREELRLKNSQQSKADENLTDKEVETLLGKTQ